MEEHGFLWLFSLLSLSSIGFTACPSNLNKSCFCEDRASGFYVTCRHVATGLNSILSPLEKLRIDRLTVVHASWPVLKRISPISIRSLRLLKCGISDIEADALAPVSDTLEELILANNSFIDFPRLGTLPKLRILSLNHNQLSSISSSAFEGIGNLNQFRVEGNRIGDLPSGIFNGLRSTLELLDLSGNNFMRVPANALSAAENVKYLDLSNNKIGSIISSDLRSLSKLIEVRLNNNALATVQPMSFSNVPQLQYLYLQNNEITDLRSIDFGHEVRLLEILDLSENALTRVPNLKNHESIRQVKLDFNKIDSVENGAFSGNPKLQLISLQNNEITSLADGSFNALSQLTILLLENNFIRKLDKGMFKGIRKLQQLNLRNNSLNELGNNTFRLIPELKMIDLAYNGLNHIPKNLFLPLRNVVWLDLSYNLLSSFEEGTFRSRIPHIILVGNPLHCDSKLDWFVSYLIRNQVRTHLPLHREVTCVSPEKFVGVRLQDLIAKKAEDTLNAMTKPLSTPSNDNQRDIFGGLIPSSLSRLIPGLTPPPPPNPVAEVPVIGGIAEAVPALRNFPGLSFLPKPQGARAQEARDLNSAIEQFSTPLLRITSGDSLLLAEDLDQMVRAVPKLAFQPTVDLTQLPSELVLRAYRGETLPGMSNEAAENSLKEHALRVYESAAAISEGKSLLKEPNHLLVLNSLPEELVAEISRGAKLPHLTEEQMRVVKEYYDVRLPTATGNDTPKDSISISDLDLSPELFRMMKLLPPKYDLNKIPKEVIDSISRGELPDFDLIPDDLKEYFRTNFEQLFGKFTKDIKYEEFLKKLPKFERNDVTTFSPYSMDGAGKNGVSSGKNLERKTELSDYAIAVVGLVSIISLVVLSAFCYRRKNKNKSRICNGDAMKSLEKSSFTDSTPEQVRTQSSVVRLLSHPEAFSTPPINKADNLSERA